MNTEIWKPVVGYETRYAVSNWGRVMNIRTGRILQPVTKYSGHLHVDLCNGSGNPTRRYYVHCLVLEAFVGPCPPGMECRHFPDRDPSNNKLENLQWGTKKENYADQILHNTNIKGQRSPHAKLKDEDVRVIKWILSLPDGERPTQAKIAKEFEVSICTINDIKFNRSWSHI